MRKMMLTAITIIISLSIDLKAERVVDYASWQNLPDIAFIDSLKKYEGKYFNLADDEFRNKGKNYQAPLVSQIYPKNYLPKGINLESHFKDYLAYFSTLNLYGVDPYRLYYNRINIKKFNEFKKAGFNILRICNYMYLPDEEFNNNSYEDWMIFFDSVIMIGLCKEVRNENKDLEYEIYEITEILKDNYSFYKPGDSVISAESMTKEALIAMYKYNGLNYDDLLIRKQINSGDTCLLNFDRFIYESGQKNNDKQENLYFRVRPSIIESGMYGDRLGGEKNVEVLRKKIELFEKINDSKNFYNRSYK